MLTFGTECGPCGMMDDIGLHSIVAVEKVYHEDSGDAGDAPPGFLLEMVERGELGVGSGKGFYEYPDPLYKQKDFLS
jgi:3-hydroxybutyryl-CoA dehydrogenase